MNEDQMQSRASPWHESAIKDREVQYSTQILSYKIEVPHGLVWNMILIGSDVQNFVFVS